MWLLILLSLFALLADLAVHTATMFGFNPQSWIRPQWLALTIFFTPLVFFLAVLYVREASKKLRAKRLGLLAPNNILPAPLRLIVDIVTAYAFLTSIDVLFRADGGSLSNPKSGIYYADPGHGRPVEQISELQFNYYQRNELRLISGVMLIFYTVCLLEFLWASLTET
jgi:hypothetical protein